METAPSLETVNQALQALYNNPDVVGKEKASVWLGELQRSVHAWQIADQLLTLHQSLEACYFAAQTMRTKIQYAFHELPANVHQSLRDSLLEHAGKVTVETAPVIVTQLSLALADLALQMVSWKSPVQDLVQRFGSNAAQLPILLEVLIVLPEEINSRSLRLGANRRDEVIEDLKSSSQVVLHLLSACTENMTSADSIQVKVLKCLSSWYNIDAIPESIVQTALFHAPFKVMVSKECSSGLHEAATDCVCNALYCVEDTSAHPMMAEALFRAVLELTEPYHRSVAEEDIDKSLNYCRMFTELAESFLEVIVDKPNQGLGDFKILELLLMCVGHHQYEVAEVTFNYWYKLSEDLYQRDVQELNEVFKPYIQRLIIALCQHCQMDPDHDGVLDPSDDFFDFRIRVSELIKDVIFIVGSSTCFTHMFHNLKNQSSETTWDVSEASLFIMAAVAKNILPDENEVVPQVVQAVLSIPVTAHIAVRYTTLQLLGELCEWIDNHPLVIDPVLQYLLAGLQESRLASVAATALQSISTMCKEHMKSHCDGLIQIAQAVDTFNISNDAATGLLRGVATILATLPHEKCADGMRKLCNFQTTELSKLLTEGTELPKQGATDDPTVWLDRLAAVFRYTTPTVTNGQVHPCLQVIQEVWPVLSQACSRYQGDVRIVERCCRCIRFAIRCLGKNSSPLLQPLVPQMVSIYQVHPHSCFLYLGSILVDEYGSDKECTQGLLDMFQAFCPPTFKLLEEQNGLRNHPDTVDDLFRLSLRFIQRAPLPFLQSVAMKPVLMCAIASCSLDHKDANMSVMKFITELIKAASSKEDREDFEARSTLVKSLLHEQGQSLVHSLIHSIVFCLPTYMSADISDVIYEIMQLDRPAFCVWLEHVLKAMPTENTGGAITVTHKQLTDFHKAVTSAEKVTQISDSVREFARLYR
ncbi:Transportin-3 [Mactra antiquata]